jgi:hypothetical protein
LPYGHILRREFIPALQGPGSEILSMVFAYTKRKADFVHALALEARIKVIINNHIARLERYKSAYTM